MRTRKPSRKREEASAKAAGGMDDTANNDRILLQARDAVIGRVHTNNRFDVPYLAGYSRDGKTIYLDRRLPKTLRVGRRRMEIWPFVMLHETIEKALVARLDLAYQDAHQIAQRVEQAAVRAAKFSWQKYQSFLMQEVQRVSENPTPRIPPDLDLEPYKDEQDWKELKEMQRASKRGERSRR